MIYCIEFIKESNSNIILSSVVDNLLGVIK